AGISSRPASASSATECACLLMLDLGYSLTCTRSSAPLSAAVVLPLRYLAITTAHPSASAGAIVRGPSRSAGLTIWAARLCCCAQPKFGYGRLRGLYARFVGPCPHSGASAT